MNRRMASVTGSVTVAIVGVALVFSACAAGAHTTLDGTPMGSVPVRTPQSPEATAKGTPWPSPTVAVATEETQYPQELTILSSQEGLALLRQKLPADFGEPTFVGVNNSADGEQQWLEFVTSRVTVKLNAVTEEIDSLTVLNARHATGEELHLDAARQRAESFAATYRPDLDLAALKLVTSERYDEGDAYRYQFEWKEYRNEVYTGSGILMELASSGALLGFHASKRNVDTSGLTIPKAQAVDLTLAFLGSGVKGIGMTDELHRALLLEDAELVAKGESVAWKITLHTPEGYDDIDHCFWVWVDARTGEVLDYAACA